MRNWIWIAPLLMVAGCSKTNAPSNSARSAPVPAASAPATPEPAAPAAESPQHAELRIPQGVSLRVRLDHPVDTRSNNAGDAFTATLDRAVVLKGEALIPAGTHFRGHLTTAAASGRMQGRPVLGLTLDSFHLQGREVRIRTNSVERVGPRHKKRNAVLIGGGAGLGAAIGAIAGGGKGAAIGALAGAGAGTAGAAATGKEQLTLGAETPFVFTTR